MVVTNNTFKQHSHTSLNSIAENYTLLFSVLEDTFFKDGTNSTYLPVNKYRTELLAISSYKQIQDTMQETMT